ncbi:chemotaxis protein CheC [Natronobacterium gregoryi]|uniref:Chemotaxis protein CheC n=2 Tax=Natronobacterium gregoryi TaxID=44930 RepID=L0AD46_NATGS|nr:chemotaxis protein CheC [Natronobacterium gregoryi]AFZ71766.1 chemotaxis protein CheC, inhibitor of MCP methylation [Natronobacterium gregoryi SP2]ELY72849.1 chemotaxis protein CheC [Natronobacterium gregoryi SP2]PLK21053.1 chemotaxis protein CheC [Natronobacterium gregoryi SP2]SFI88309.1 chemotaxis protein CheC [Natronobacterium gregoryi]
MKLDVNALGTFYRMAREGAGLAAGRLTHMTDVETQVGVTKLNFMRGSEICQAFDDSTEKVGIRVDLDGAIEGYSVIVFEREAALRIVDTIVSEPETAAFDEMTRSAVTEVGHIMNSGFVDGWADVLESVIDVSTPELVIDESADQFFNDVDETAGPGQENDLALLFQSRIETVDTEVGFSHYLFPTHRSMSALLDRLRTSDGIAYDKLEGFDRMAERGAKEIATTATTLTGIETSVEIRRLNFVSLEAIPQSVPDEQLVGVAFEFDGVPSGYLVFLFDERSARKIVDAMVPTVADGVDGDPGEFDEMETSAITELGNIMASGFLDGWANVLDTTIDHSTPEFIHDIGAAAVDPVVVQLGSQQEFAFVFDTIITADGRDIDCEVYAIPNEADLERALNDLDVDRVEEEPTTAEFQEVDNA